MRIGRHLYVSSLPMHLLDHVQWGLFQANLGPLLAMTAVWLCLLHNPQEHAQNNLPDVLQRHGKGAARCGALSLHQ